MDNRPIGFFDSGLGGLTCIPYLMDKMPNEKIIYFGDTARTPYGSKAVSTIKNFSMQIADFLVSHDVKMIVIACNTVSATCLLDIQNKYPDIPVVGIIEPAAIAVAETCGVSNKIGVIGTKVTISSEAYKNEIKKYNHNLSVYEKACPAFVPLIEEGIIKNDIMDLTIEYYMDDFILENRIDTIVLGCTHYPLLGTNIKRKYPNLKIINPSQVIINKIERILKDKNMLAMPSEMENVFYASDLSENFLKMIDRIFDETNVKVKFKNLDID
ncbi:MAG: glutamate racemase [Anaerovoracaceae bacterium]